ncbi:BZ3500_MvSof-1268-A1-R1_Chr6-3g09007 [Microbotryum saponariae]|uniref:BZ3500_MvSof-1268-A1-R1_Chr6-3g09007 protein n=1 Tax=Microbotryum saponariae TaxID=289078 RepID=A0A2X0MI09_9BASI|nr:BZ3500_MvSof-1268-A1-R1_Chr6-3g09007 [Microbotryum saponariae]SDA07609.1 BZ3501_MvSof-1269-A2-R1_Chr6-2g08711 [Microbotryum saponariae]
MSIGYERAQLPSPLAKTSPTTITPTTTTIDPRLDFVAGTVAGVASLLTGQPFDTIKVRLQCQDRSQKTYRNAVHGFFKIVEEEKVRSAGALGEQKLKGLFKGVTSPMLGVAAINACVFSSYGLAQRLLSPLLDNSNSSKPTSNPSLLIIVLSGSVSGLLTSIITTPIERLKILQQSVRGTTRQPSLVELVRQIGARGLYRGWMATCWRDLGYGPYFGVYEAVIRSQNRFGSEGGEREEVQGNEVGTAKVLIAGGMAGIAGWGSTFAMDVVKTRIQASEAYLDQARTIAHPYRTISSTIRHSYRAQGFKVFFVGLGPTLLRSVPVNMVCFFVFEAIVSAFR